MARVIIDGAALQRVISSPSGPVFRHLGVLADRVVNRARQIVGKDTRQTERSLIKRPITDRGQAGWAVGWFSEPEATIGSYQEFGTRPHPIDPIPPRKVLVFHWAKVGRVVFLRHVDHPGTKAVQPLRRAVREVFGKGF